MSFHPDNAAHFSAGLRKARLREGWTQAQLAAKAGLTQGTVSRVEHGVDLTLGVACQLAKALKKPVSSILLIGAGKRPL
jgi:transcriptional regulator with XRE-family HTH domain